jgi:hypothetical protein
MIHKINESPELNESYTHKIKTKACTDGLNRLLLGSVHGIFTFKAIQILNLIIERDD